MGTLTFCDSCHVQIDITRCRIQYYTKHFSPHWEEVDLCENCGKKIVKLLNLKLKTVDVSGMMM